MLNIGDTAPDFTLANEDGEELSLTEMLSDGPVILYFYPADFTPICTAEACSIRDMYEDISSVGVKVIGISPQNSNSHTRFKMKYDIPFPLLFDSGKKVIRQFGVDGILGIGVRRATFLIGEGGVIENKVVSDLFVSSHVNFIKEVIKDRAKEA